MSMALGSLRFMRVALGLKRGQGANVHSGAAYTARRMPAALRVLGWRSPYPTYPGGPAALLSDGPAGTDFARSATTMPASASTPPATASGDQR